GKPRGATAARPRTSKPVGFAYWRHRVDTAGADPKACIELSRPLDPAKSYGDYVLISPETPNPVGVAVSGGELCVSGLGFADRRITLLKGLPGKGRDKLAANVDVDFVFGAPAPYVGFAGDG